MKKICILLSVFGLFFAFSAKADLLAPLTTNLTKKDVCGVGLFKKDCSKSQKDLDRKYCSSHGQWDMIHRKCLCQNDWWGSDCSKVIDKSCSGNGVWMKTYCSCFSGWGGGDCSIKDPCSGAGYWRNKSKKCDCSSGYSGPDCSKTEKEQNALYCSGHGKWDGTWEDSLCACDEGWGGLDCSLTARKACSNHGYWNKRPVYCDCDAGWGGR